jgi:hypothetical protein
MRKSQPSKEPDQIRGLRFRLQGEKKHQVAKGRGNVIRRVEKWSEHS